MTLEQKLDIITVSKGIAPLMDVKEYSFIHELFRDPLGCVKTVSFLVYALLHKKEMDAIGGYNDYFVKDPETADRELQETYNQLGLKTKEEQFSWQFLCNVQPLMYLHTPARFNEPVTFESFEKDLYESLESSMEVLHPACGDMHGARVNPDFHERAYAWISEQIRSKIEEGDVTVFERFHMRKRKDVILMTYIPLSPDRWALSSANEE